jgi:hypothetical protein
MSPMDTTPMKPTGESQYDDLERRLAGLPGHRRAHHHPRGRRQRRATPGRQRLRQQIHRQVRAPVIEGGIGHNLPQEALQASAEAIIDADSHN